MIICPSQSPKKEGNNVVIGLAKGLLLGFTKALENAVNRPAFLPGNAAL